MAHVFTMVTRLRLPQAFRVTTILILYATALHAPAARAFSADFGSAAAPISPTRDVIPFLTLEEALRLATEHNSDIRAATTEVAAVEAARIQLAARPNPEISYSMEDTQKATRTTTLQLSQVLELGGKRKARIDAGELTRQAASADRVVKVTDVRASVIAAYFEVLIGQERVVLANAALELAQRGTDLAGKRVTAGKVSPVEETKARVAQANVKVELTQAQAELASARGRLCAIWNAPSQCFGTAAGPVADLPDLLPFDDLVALAKDAPGVRRAALEVDRRGALARVEKTRQTPNVTVSLGVKRAEDIGRNQALIGVSVPLPLFDRNQGNLSEALLRTDKARDELAAMESRVRADLWAFHQQLAASRDTAAVLQDEVIPGAQSAYMAATKGFDFGKFTYLDVLDAQRTLLQAKTQYLTALAAMHRARAEIERLIGAQSANTPLRRKTPQ